MLHSPLCPGCNSVAKAVQPLHLEIVVLFDRGCLLPSRPERFVMELRKPLMSPDQLQTEKQGKPEPAKTTAYSVDPERWLDEYGDELFSFTILRVRDRVTAQDL